MLAAGRSGRTWEGRGLAAGRVLPEGGPQQTTPPSTESAARVAWGNELVPGTPTDSDDGSPGKLWGHSRKTQSCCAGLKGSPKGKNLFRAEVSCLLGDQEAFPSGASLGADISEGRFSLAGLQWGGGRTGGGGGEESSLSLAWANHSPEWPRPLSLPSPRFPVRGRKVPTGSRGVRLITESRAEAHSSATPGPPSCT